jgi:hypothetical protein
MSLFAEDNQVRWLNLLTLVWTYLRRSRMESNYAECFPAVPSGQCQGSYSSDDCLLPCLGYLLPISNPTIRLYIN